MSSEKSKKTERKIFNSAVDLIFKKGYNAATTSEIAKRAGVAEGTIFRYYPNKKEFLHKIVYEVINKFGDKVAIDTLISVIEKNKNSDIEVLIRAVVNDRIELVSKNLHMLKILLNEVQYHSDIRELLQDKIKSKISPVIEGAIENQIELGNIRRIDSSVIFKSIAGIIFANLLLELAAEDEIDYARVKENIYLGMDIFINGIREKKGDEL